MNYEVVRDIELDFNGQLRMEMGWGDVASGLTKVLFGYGTLFLGTAIGVGLLAVSMYSFDEVLGKEVAKKAAQPKASLGQLWCLYLGMGILSVIGLISYCIIIGGQFRCMMGAAERHGARWFMFICIACLFLGPAFHIATGIANYQALAELKNHPRRIETFQLNPMGQWLQLIGFAISMVYPLFFILFLRAVAVCMRADAHVMLVNVFVVIACSLVAATGYELFEHRPGTKPLPPQHTMALGLAWGVMLVLYAGLIGVIRICIQKVIGNVKSPLEM
jgi:hypothetical protein